MLKVVRPLWMEQDEVWKKICHDLNEFILHIRDHLGTNQLHLYNSALLLRNNDGMYVSKMANVAATSDNVATSLKSNDCLG